MYELYEPTVREQKKTFFFHVLFEFVEKLPHHSLIFGVTKSMSHKSCVMPWHRHFFLWKRLKTNVTSTHKLYFHFCKFAVLMYGPGNLTKKSCVFRRFYKPYSKTNTRHNLYNGSVWLRILRNMRHNFLTKTIKKKKQFESIRNDYHTNRALFILRKQ